MKMTPCILFEVAGTTYALPARDVHQVEMIDQVTPVPSAPPFVDGLVYARGKVVPVVNLRRRFGFESIAYDLSARLVVIRMQQRLVGLGVDSAREFLNLDEETISPPPPAIVSAGNQAVRGVLTHHDRLILWLDPDLLLSDEDVATPSSRTDERS